MRTTAITFWALLLANFCRAQNFREWFRQNATQKNYLIEQIAQLKIYLELTRKGYSIAKDGLDMIGQIKQGEFNLHKNRFDSLLIVNPRIRSYKRIGQISDLHAGVVQTCEKLSQQVSSSFSAGQRQYINKVLKLVYDDSESVLGNLLLIIENGKLSTTDDQRIQRIEQCFEKMQDNYLFVRDFEQKTKFLASQIKAGQAEISNQKSIHGLN